MEPEKCLGHLGHPSFLRTQGSRTGRQVACDAGTPQEELLMSRGPEGALVGVRRGSGAAVGWPTGPHFCDPGVVLGYLTFVTSGIY